MKLSIGTFLLCLCMAVIVMSCEKKRDEESASINKEQTVLQALGQDWTSYFDREMKALNCIGGSWVIVGPNGAVMDGAYGLRHPTDAIGVDEHTLYRIGSLSKGFAGILTAKLAAEDVLSLDDPVNKYLPGFKFKDSTISEQVRIRHILSHTTGLPRHAYTDLLEYGRSAEEIMPRLIKLDLIGMPGEIHAYQNACFSLIENVLESVTGSPYPELLQNTFFHPLKMTRTNSSALDFLNCCNLGRPCSSYGHTLLNYNERYYNAVSAGGINSTAHDMGLWMRALLDSSDLTIAVEAVETAFGMEVETQALQRRYYSNWSGIEEIGYGLGWRVMQRYGRKIVHHRGNVNNYSSEILLIPDLDVGLCVLYNNECPMVRDLGEVFLNMQDFYWQVFQCPDAVYAIDEQI